MRYFKLTIAYDGTDFHGWQVQTNKPTIQGEITNILGRLTQERLLLYGAGRTDAGVHALGQVASFKTLSALSAGEFQRALNALLPPTIRIVGAYVSCALVGAWKNLSLPDLSRQSGAADDLALRAALSVSPG
jgi:tRNA pseudouridine38-40 synthase